MEKKARREEESTGVRADNLKLKGILRVEHYRNGKKIDERLVENLIVDVGKSQVAGLIGAVVTDAFGYVAVGTGTTSPASTDTALGSEVMRVASINTRVTTNITNDTLQLQAIFNFTASYSITEAGIFNASSGGVMLARQTFGAINVVSGDSIVITWKVIVS